MSQPLRALLIEDCEDDAIFIRRSLERGGFDLETRRVQSASELRAALEKPIWDVIISDYRMPGFSGLDALKIVQGKGLDIPFIIVSGVIGEEQAVEAMRAGANDFVMKERLARLAPAVARELQEHEVRRARLLAEDKLQKEYKLRLTIEKTIPSGLVIWDLHGKIDYVNPSFCQLVGWSERNLRESKPPYIFWPLEQRNAYLEHFWQFVKAPADSLSFESRLRRADGQEIHVLVLCARLRNAAGAPDGWLASFTDITTRKRAEEALQQLNAELEHRVEERTRALHLALQNLRHEVAERTKLENELLDILEKERRKLGLELHDDLGQRLSGLTFMCKGLAVKLKKKRLPEAAEASAIFKNLDDAIQLTRGLARSLFVGEQEKVSLLNAIQALAERTEKIFGASCSFQCKGEIPTLSPETERHLCYIAQEALHNGLKHGKATKLQISLLRNDGCVELAIRNNGRPFPAVDKLKAGTGLRIMNYRAHVIGGSLEVRSITRGTEVVVRLRLVSNGK